MTPEAFRVLSEKRPMAIPVIVPLLLFVPARILGVMTLWPSITVLPLFQSATQSSKLASTPGGPGVPDLTLYQPNEIVKV